MPDLSSLLKRAPPPLRRFASSVAAGRGPLGRLADRVRFPYHPRDIPPLPDSGAADRRVLIGPNNTAEQGFMWARALERELPSTKAIAVTGFDGDAFEVDVDLRIPEAVYLRSASWHAAFESYLETRTHVLWESGLSLLGRRYGMSAAREVRSLSERGVECGLIFHGSDIRRPSLHATVGEWSPFAASTREISVLEKETAANAAMVAELGVPSFVSTPDLLRWLPQAEWFPVVVDPARWRSTGSRTDGTPIVVHAPSNPWIKGTYAIEPVLRRLHEEGVIEYRQIVGVPHAAIPAFYAEADVVLDQFTLGIYGVAACEAMASGRLVMSHVDEFTRRQVRERTGFDLPVHETTVATLEAELRRFAEDRESFSEIRDAGPGFVAAVHDGRRSAAALAPFLGVSPAAPSAR